MAGHSKWSQIKRKKQITDQKKGADYAKFSKEISIAVKLGGEEIEYNFRLRNAVERARTLGVPNDIIQRAINKSHEQKENLEEILYEGYANAGIAILIETQTDNRNRTVAELRHILGKYQGNLGESGCVSWNFRQIGVISISKELLNINENLEEELIELLADQLEDISLDDDPENILLFTVKEQLESAIQKLQIKNIKALAELIYLPVNSLIITQEQMNNLEELTQRLEDLDDISKIWHNAELINVVD